MTPAQLKIYRGVFDMLIEFILVIAGVVLLFGVTTVVLMKPSVSGVIVECGVLSGTIYVVYNSVFKKRCPACNAPLEKA